jgi:hypothetical protein
MLGHKSGENGKIIKYYAIEYKIQILHHISFYNFNEIIVSIINILAIPSLSSVFFICYSLPTTYLQYTFRKFSLFQNKSFTLIHLALVGLFFMLFILFLPVFAT